MTRFLTKLYADSSTIYDKTNNTSIVISGDVSPSTDAKVSDYSIRLANNGNLTATFTTRDTIDSTEDYTIAFWFKSETRADYEAVLSWVLSNTSNDYNAVYPSQGYLFVRQINESAVNLKKSGFYVPNEWKHYALVRKNKITKAYIDGVFQGVVTGSDVDRMNAILYTLGYSYASYDNSQWGGCIDDFTVIAGKAMWVDDFTPPTTVLSLSKVLIKNVLTDEVYGKTSLGIEKLLDNWGTSTDVEKELAISKADAVFSGEVSFPFSILSTDKSVEQFYINVLPKPQLVTPKGLIDTTIFERINSITVTSTEKVTETVSLPKVNNITLIVTTDNTTYYTWDKLTLDWVEIDHTNLEQVQKNGIKPSEISTLTSADWDKLIKKPNVEGIGFAYYLEQGDFNDVVEVDKISLNVDMVGSWANAKVGTDYDYEYPSNKSLSVTLLSNGDYKINY